MPRKFSAAVGTAALTAAVVAVGFGGAAHAVTSHESAKTFAVGARPNGITAVASTHTAYSAISGADKIAVIDTTTGTVSTDISLPGGSRPYGVAVDQADSRAYTSNNGTGTVSVIDTTTNAIVGSINVGGAPDGIGYDPGSDSVYVTNGNSNTVFVINTTSQAVTSIAVGSAPSSVGFDPSEHLAVVTNYIGQSVSFIDTTLGSVTSTVDLGDRPQRVAVDAVHHVAYVTAGNSVLLFDTTSDSYLSSIPVGQGAFGVGVDPDNNTLYVANGDDASVSLIDTTTDAVTQTVTVGDFPVGIAVDPTLDTAFVNNFNDGSVTEIAPVPNQSQTITFTSSPTDPRVGDTYDVSATGGASGNPVTFSVDPSSGNRCTLVDHGDSTATVTFVHIGSCKIDADQAGAPGFDPAPQAVQKIAVNQGKQVITYTSTPPNHATVGDTYDVTATGGDSGQPVRIAAAPSRVCTLSNVSSGMATVTFNAPGTCVLNATQRGTKDYAAARPVRQKIVVRAS